MSDSAKEKIVHAIESMEFACQEARRRVEWADRLGDGQSDLELAASVNRCLGNGISNAMGNIESAMSRIGLRHAMELDSLKREGPQTLLDPEPEGASDG